MTRINMIEPRLLLDQHLMAEYRELPMVPASLWRTINSKHGFRPEKIPASYTLNAGHVTFFYDKGTFLRQRYDQLRRELKLRGFNIDDDRESNLRYYEQAAVHGFDVMNDYLPTIGAVNINTNRILERVAQKRHWYRYCGVPIVQLLAPGNRKTFEATLIELNRKAETMADIIGVTTAYPKLYGMYKADVDRILGTAQTPS